MSETKRSVCDPPDTGIVDAVRNIFLLLLLLVGGCKPELPVTSSITVDMEGFTFPVNKTLYGLSIEEINHAIEGGLYAELIQNRSFEDGVVPPHCSYDPRSKRLVTPNGWDLPFPSPDSIPGWKRLAGNTYVTTDHKNLINEKNQRSLLVSVTTSAAKGRGGVIAEGYQGIPIRKGEKYNLSFYTRTATSVVPKTIRAALEDSAGTNILSDVYQVKPTYEWTRHQHTFTAKEDANNAVLTFSTDSTAFFWLDVVSLFPEKTWKNRTNGLRPDLAEMIAQLKPAFIRFPGGSFAEGYTLGTYPIWHESLGDIEQRKHFWNIRSYGSSNGMGFHEFLEMCEEMDAEPIYVINSGVTSQKRKARYVDFSQMESLAEDYLKAIAYANDPASTPYGAERAKNGHPEPFNLKYVEIGSENTGYEYERRFEFFRKTVQEQYPDMTIISSSLLDKQPQNVWADHHFYSDAVFFIANHNRFSRMYSRHYPGIFIGEFSTIDKEEGGTLQAAIAEACFLIGAERNPGKVKKLAYAPVLGRIHSDSPYSPLISFNHSQAVASPSYHLLKMFNENRGDELLKTETRTYHKPQVTFGKAGVEIDDANFDIRNIKLDNRLLTHDLILDKPRNLYLFGDSSLYNYEFSADFKRTKNDGKIKLYVRANDRPDKASHISMTLGAGNCELHQQSGAIKDTISSPQPFEIKNEEWYHVRMACINDTIRCYINNVIIHETVLAPLPSLIALATYDKTAKTILLKVINTTYHEEKTAINVQGASTKNQAVITQLSGLPAYKNTLEEPDKVFPREKEISFPLGSGMVYSFPPNSISIMKIAVN